MSKYSDTNLRSRGCCDLEGSSVQGSCSHAFELSSVTVYQRSSRKLQQKFLELGKKYWGQHFWALGFGCWSTGNITDEMVNEYLEHHRKPTDKDDSNFILE